MMLAKPVRVAGPQPWMPVQKLDAFRRLLNSVTLLKNSAVYTLMRFWLSI
jgi:hypothetical protein